MLNIVQEWEIHWIVFLIGCILFNIGYILFKIAITIGGVIEAIRLFILMKARR